MRRFRRWQWEQKTRARLREYWRELLPDSQRELENLLQSPWITTEPKEGIYYHRSVEIADTVTRMIEAERRAAWRKMERWTVVLEQRAEKAEAQAEALQEELKALRQLLPGAMRQDIEQQARYINIVDAHQADNPRAVVPLAQPAAERDDDEDDARTYAILAQAGIKPIAQALAEQQEEPEDDDTERYDREDGEDYEEEEEG
jgi:hypothetical protein